jgi:hypothetical protein
MGLLSKELIDTFGRETARRIAIRFGFADGYHDAVNLRNPSDARGNRSYGSSHARRIG